MACTPAQLAAKARWREKNRARKAEADRSYRRLPEVRERNRTRTAAYRRTDHGRAVRNAHNRSVPLEKRRAWRLVREAVKAGVLVPLPCRDCGSTRVKAHHHRGYSVEYRLDVIWLCSPCHAAEHAADGAAKED